MSFTKFFRTTFLKNTSGPLLPYLVVINYKSVESCNTSAVKKNKRWGISRTPQIDQNLIIFQAKIKKLSFWLLIPYPRFKKSQINPSQLDIAFLYPWKHQKTFMFSDVFRGYRKATPGCNGLIMQPIRIESYSTLWYYKSS